MSTETAKEGERSCVGCPSFLPDSPETEGFFGSRTSMDHCARFGYVLGTKEMHPRQAEGLRKATARNCNSYMMPRPSGPIWVDINPAVTVPNREAVTAQMMAEEIEVEQLTSNPVHNCRECIFMNQAETGRREWKGTGICSARNELVFKDQFREKANRCGSKIPLIRYSGNRTLSHQISSEERLLPSLVDAYFKVMTPLESWQQGRATFVDPTEYKSDRAVFQEDIERGIRAWREIVDQDTGNSVFIPVYDRKLLPEHLQDLVPQTGDDEHPENYIDYEGLVFLLSALWWELDETPLIWGPAGVGKTEVLRHMAWLMQLPFHRISVTATSEVDDLVGTFQLRDGRTEFMQGRLPRAWSSPGVICLDEPNVGPPEVWQAIRPLTDNSKQFVVDKAGGLIIKRHPDSVFAMAANPAWDTRNIGADMIADADSSRLSHLFVDYPPEEIEREIMREWADEPGANWKIADATLDTIVRVASDLRGLAREGRISTSWGVRHSIKVAKLSRIFPLPKAYQIALMNYLDPREREEVETAISSSIG